MDLATEGRPFVRSSIVGALGIAVMLFVSFGATEPRVRSTHCPALRHDPATERAVEAFASHHAEQLKACYLDSLAAGGVAEKLMVVNYTIDRDGKLVVVHLDKRASEPLGRCLIAQMETWQLDGIHHASAGGFQLHFE
jgi:hypothetical protein